MGGFQAGLRAARGRSCQNVPGSLWTAQEYDHEHPNIDLPYKKPKNGGLAEEEKQYNRGLASFRVAVLYCIGRCKRFLIVSERYRNPLRTHHTKPTVVAGLVTIAAAFNAFRVGPPGITASQPGRLTRKSGYFRNGSFTQSPKTISPVPAG